MVWVDRRSNHFYKDIYGHDERLSKITTIRLIKKRTLSIINYYNSKRQSRLASYIKSSYLHIFTTLIEGISSN
jgi:hypothetical protein